MLKVWVDGVDEGWALLPAFVDVTLEVDETVPETEPEEEPLVEVGAAVAERDEVGRRRHFFCVRFARFLATL